MNHTSIVCCLVLAACAADHESQSHQSMTGSGTGSGSACVETTMTATCAAPRYRGEYRIVQEQAFPASGAWNCLYEPLCITDGIGAAPLGSDEQCTDALDRACAGVPTSAPAFWRSQSTPCNQPSAETVERMQAWCTGSEPPTASAQCLVCSGETRTGLCPEGDATIEWRSGCGTPTTTAGTGSTLLAEFGAADGNSADFQCQWVQSCSVSAPDLGSPSYDDATETITQCTAADGNGANLCDLSQLATAGQARSVLFTRRWVRGTRVYYNDLFYREVTRDEVRAQAQADCDAAVVPAGTGQGLCNDALSAVLASIQLSMRLFYCCTTSVLAPEPQEEPLEPVVTPM